MHKLKKALSLLILSSLCISMFSGCKDKKEIQTVSTPTEIELSWWGNDPRHLYTMEGVDRFQELHPDISVTYQYGVWAGFETRNQVKMKSKTESDVMQINYGWLDIYSPDGNGYYDLYELSDYIDLSNFTEDDLKFGEVNGKLNALPIAFNTQTIFYNKTIFDAYNLDIPKTWDDLFEAAKVMREDGIYPLGMAKKHVFLLLVAYYEQTTGKHFFDENGKFLLNEEEVAYVLDFYKRLIDEKVMTPVDQWNRNQLTDGTSAGTACWISDTSSYCGSIEAGDGVPIVGDYIGVKEAKTLSGWYMKPATMYAISNITEHPEEAATLLDYLLNNPEMAMLQGTEKGIPVSESALTVLTANGMLEDLSSEANQKMLDERDNINIMITAMENENIIDIFKDQADTYLYEKATIEEAASAIVDGIHEYEKMK